MFVYVLDINGNPLMPTQKCGKVRRMLRDKQAKIVKYDPFTIQLCYETTNFVEEINLGVDTGSKHVGVSATTPTQELFATEVILRTDIKKLLEKRKELRQKRHQCLRYRKPRYKNRKATKKEGWIAPSLRWRVDAHIKIIKFVRSILPIKNIHLELGDFDTQKLQNEYIESEMYQQGLMNGFDNMKMFVRWRDGNVCQQCNGKSGDKKLEVHHIAHKKDGGSDRPNNLICLCHICHKEYHQGKLKLKKFKQLNKKNADSLRDAAVMNITKDVIYNRCIEEFPQCSVHRTFGYITKFYRKKYNIEKTHMSDARVISKNFNAVPAAQNVYLSKMLRRHNKHLYKENMLKGGIWVSTRSVESVFGYHFYDRVKYNGKVCFVSGRRATGSFRLKNLDGTVVHQGISYKKLKFIKHEQRFIFQRIK